MPIFREGSQVFFFAHVPKCGGTSLEHALINHGVNLTLIDEAYWQHSKSCWYRSSPQHATLEDISAIFPPSIVDQSFAVVRDPVSRFLSAFNHNRRARRIPFTMSIEKFTKKISRRCDYYGRTMDNHFLPAVRFVPHDAKIFTLEDGLDTLSDWLYEVTNGSISIAIQSKNAMPYNDTAGRSFIRRFVKANLVPETPDASNLSEAVRGQIYDLYQEDYERFKFKT